MNIQKAMVVVFLSLFSFYIKANVDLIIFSYNRPLQLYAFLESIDLRVKNLEKIMVLYRADKQNYCSAYNEVKESFPQVMFVKQGSNPRVDFRHLLMECFDTTDNTYVMFGVDDTIVTGSFDVLDCVKALEKTGAYCFCLRLGTNIIHNSFNYESIQVPNLSKVMDNTYQYCFDHGSGDWNYPHTVVMNIYRKEDIRSFFASSNYTSPNTLEGNWAGVAPKNRSGLCFKKSVVTMIPLNLVQTDWHNPNFNYFSAEVLLKKWQEGLKIDVQPFFNIDYTSENLDAKPQFIPRF